MPKSKPQGVKLCDLLAPKGGGKRKPAIQEKLEAKRK